MFKRALGIGGAAACLVMACSAPEAGSEPTGQARQELVRGTPVPVSDVPSVGRPYVVMVLFETFDLNWTACSGTYFAPRVVLTAAHCVPPQYVAGGYVYWGNDFEDDIANVFAIPPPGQPSVFAKADSWQVNPDYLKDYFDADMAVVFLDRKPPFDPLPLYRNRLDASWTNQPVTLVGWGANLALSQDTSDNEGFGVKRTGTARVLGTPTLADYEPTSDEAPLLTPTVRSHVVKLNGKSPNVNLCSGDSGGPILVNKYGQDYVAGVASRTGDYCENTSLFTRIDPYLPFLDDSYRRGGQAPLVPSLDCVDTWLGKQTAYFGYDNENGVSVSVPYGSSNSFPLDVNGARPSLFRPGDNRFQFGIDVKAGQNLDWKLNPPNGPFTEVRASTSSPKCTDSVNRRCARYCQATVASACWGDFDATWDDCFNPCVDGYDNQWLGTSCENQWISYLSCVANTPPTASNWECEPGFDTVPVSTVCSDLVTDALNCLYPPSP